jgi:hypothetical protein
VRLRRRPHRRIPHRLPTLRNRRKSGPPKIFPARLALSPFVGDPKNKPKPASSKPANAPYVASVRKQLDKLQGQIADIDKQLVDLKNFSEGKPSTSASGIKLNKSYQREPIEVQMRALQDKKKDLESKIDELLDEARKRGVESSQLR